MAIVSLRASIGSQIFVIMHLKLTTFLIAFSVASTTGGQTPNNVSPFVMISNEPYNHTQLNTHTSALDHV